MAHTACVIGVARLTDRLSSLLNKQQAPRKSNKWWINSSQTLLAHPVVLNHRRNF